MDTPHKERVMNDKQFQREVNKAAIKGGLIGLKYAWRHKRALYCEAMRQEHMLWARVWEGLGRRESAKEIILGVIELKAALALSPEATAHREAVVREVDLAMRSYRWSSDLPS